MESPTAEFVARKMSCGRFRSVLVCLRASGLQTLFQFREPSSCFLSSDRAEQFRRCFPSICRSCMPGCRRCHLRLKATVPWLEDNLKRFMKSPVLHDAFPAQYKPLLFDTAFPAQTNSVRLPSPANSTFHTQSGVVVHDHVLFL